MILPALFAGQKWLVLSILVALLVGSGAGAGWKARAKIADREAETAAAKIAVATEQRETCRANLDAQGQAVRQLREAENRLATKAQAAMKQASEYRAIAETRKSRLESINLSGDECHDLSTIVDAVRCGAIVCLPD